MADGLLRSPVEAVHVGPREPAEVRDEVANAEAVAVDGVRPVREAGCMVSGGGGGQPALERP